MVPGTRGTSSHSYTTLRATTVPFDCAPIRAEAIWHAFIPRHSNHYNLFICLPTHIAQTSYGQRQSIVQSCVSESDLVETGNVVEAYIYEQTVGTYRNATEYYIAFYISQPRQQIETLKVYFTENSLGPASLCCHIRSHTGPISSYMRLKLRLNQKDTHPSPSLFSSLLSPFLLIPGSAKD